jgi:iron complex transport system permease protein
VSSVNVSSGLVSATRLRGTRLRVSIFYAVLLPLLLVSVLAATAIGSTYLPWQSVLHVIALKLLPSGSVSSQGLTVVDIAVIWLIRVPRVIVAGFVGAGLAVAGTVMQALFRNPLAEPGLVGTGAGAVLGGVLSFVMGWSVSSVMALPAAAVIGALISLLLVYAMATRGGITPVNTLLLCGISVGLLLGAMSSLLLSINIVNWQLAQDIVFWMMGGLDARSWTHVWICAPFVTLGVGTALFQSRDLDLLQQGEETAASFGVDVEAAKRLLILTAALLTGASVAVAGLIGFVGLVIPHAARLALGPSNRNLVPASALAGASFLILCDLFARTVHPPTELRLGIVTSLIGGPIFIAMLLKRYRQSGGNS